MTGQLVSSANISALSASLLNACVTNFSCNSIAVSGNSFNPANYAQTSALNDYLRLTGGEMTGQLVSSANISALSASLLNACVANFSCNSIAVSGNSFNPVNYAQTSALNDYLRLTGGNMTGQLVSSANISALSASLLNACVANFSCNSIAVSGNSFNPANYAQTSALNDYLLLAGGNMTGQLVSSANISALSASLLNACVANFSCNSIAVSGNSFNPVNYVQSNSNPTFNGLTLTAPITYSYSLIAGGLVNSAIAISNTGGYTQIKSIDLTPGTWILLACAYINTSSGSTTVTDFRIQIIQTGDTPDNGNSFKQYMGGATVNNGGTAYHIQYMKFVQLSTNQTWNMKAGTIAASNIMQTSGLSFFTAVRIA
jgi:hypothetical protein